MQTEHAKAACEAVVLAFFHALDTRRHEAAASLIAPDGTWLRQGQLLTGPREVLAALEARPPQRTTCHVITNLRLLEYDGSRAMMGYFLTAYDSDPQVQGGAPRLVAIRDCQDRLAVHGQDWLLAEKRSRRHLPPE
ncbi:nuclear transport factor 2 family protein [Achromobacter xylosoxidans]|uniref:nuclear transport factor 2 family protein n=1 Tax=Alcaligenes xylosoxydans xylosoxydans TaxID=85698 RepID=UPI00080A900E|nr:nuclear transport factor 2 family protein [Achromobacter xylosoxidans]MCZ8383827.1 nuclear transport factor 2 family protein [Achromobacter xylosoxidans]